MITFHHFLSLIPLLLSVYFLRKTIYSNRHAFLHGIIAYIVILFNVAFSFINYFTGVGIDDSVIYHISYGFSGAGFYEYRSLLLNTLIVLLVSLFLLEIFLIIPSGRKNENKHIKKISFVLLSFSFIFNPIAVSAVTYYYSSNAFRFDSNENLVKFEKLYRNPDLKQISDSTKNFVFIYAESLERTYFDENLFPGLVTELKEFQDNSTFFTNINQLSGTHWTIAGIVASQCGIPLVTHGIGNSMSGVDKFLPGAVCLSDSLKKEGYYLSFYGGASLDFAGKGAFLKTHQFDEIKGKSELLPIVEDKKYHSGWGLYDDTLLDISYKRFLDLSETKEKFGLFLLTLDTHHPHGHISRNCRKISYKNGENPILNAVKCSDYLISKFIKKILASPYADNTVIVIVSDHLAMNNNASYLLDRSERRNLFMIIDPSSNYTTGKYMKNGSMLDITPTMLPYIGYETEIGLGRNLLKTNLNLFEVNYIQENLRKYSKEIYSLWNFPRIKNTLEINISKNTFNIDNRVFKFPALIELNKSLETSMKFEFYSQKRLISHVKNLRKNRYFLLIDKCSNLNKLGIEDISGNDFCLLSGIGNRYIKNFKLKDNFSLTTDEIKSLFSRY